jgi:phage host-nuclease inhibitor protein Gam
MVRKRIDANPVIGGWAELDDQLRYRKEKKLELAKIEARAGMRIDEIKQQLKESAKSLQDEIKTTEKMIEDFCNFNRDQLDGQKSRRLNFGLIGWRKSPGKVVTLTKWTFGRVVEKMIDLKMNDYLRIKNPELDKDAVREAFKSNVLTENDLKKIGLKVEEPEEFFIEQDEVAAAEMPEMGVVRKERVA